MGYARWVRIAVAGLAATLISGATFTGAAAVAAAADPRPVINKPVTVDAPTDRKGGVMNAFVSCSDYNVEPRTRWTLTSLASGKSHTYRWRGALPGMYFPRVAVGRYRSETTAWCAGAKAERTHVVEVGQKTPQTTISRAEFANLRRGMTRARVRDEVGFNGRDCWRYGRENSCIYDMMPFWKWSVITFRNDRLVTKDWNVGHD